MVIRADIHKLRLPLVCARYVETQRAKFPYKTRDYAHFRMGMRWDEVGWETVDTAAMHAPCVTMDGIH